MAESGCPVIFDAAHRVQQPGPKVQPLADKERSHPWLARAACAVGVAAIFMEAHEDPDNAPADRPNMVPVSLLDGVISTSVRHDMISKGLG